MFVYSLKASTLKLVAILCVAVLTLVTLLALIPTYEPASAGETKINYSNIKSNDERIAFISQFGWQVEPVAKEEAEVTIPKEFDKVFSGYNTIQKNQGLNLEKYKNKTVTRYTYVVTNYPDYDGTVYFNMLVYKDRVIGGDVCSAALDGFIHGFAK